MKKFIIILVMAVMASVAIAEELLVDPGFESGAWDGAYGWFNADAPYSYSWQYATVAQQSTDVRNGSNAMGMEMKSAWSWGYTWSYAYTSQDLTFTPAGGQGGWAGCWDSGIVVAEGDVLQATVWVKDGSGAGGAGLAKVALEWYDDSGNRDWDNEVSTWFDLTGDWSQLTLTGTAPAGVSTMTLGLGIGNYSFGRQILFDDASLTIIPEPMTIGLLGLGALFLRRRKA